MSLQRRCNVTSMLSRRWLNVMCPLGCILKQCQYKGKISVPFEYPNYLDCVMRKRVFGHMRTAKAKINLRIHAFWSGPSLSAYIFRIPQNVWMESKGPDDTLNMCRMICICAWCACSKAPFRMIRSIRKHFFFLSGMQTAKMDFTLW